MKISLFMLHLYVFYEINLISTYTYRYRLLEEACQGVCFLFSGPPAVVSAQFSVGGFTTDYGGLKGRFASHSSRGWPGAGEPSTGEP